MPQPTEIALSADAVIVDALRAGDESAFVELIQRYGAQMVRVAMLYVPTRAVAEEVVQDAWLGVLEGIGRFEGRSSLKTWIFRILTNIAKSRGERERRTVPFSTLAGPEDAERSVDPERFQASGRWAGHWSPDSAPRPWDVPEQRLVARETLEITGRAIAELPPTQRTVITLRDVEGWSAEEVCNVLEITETNQRVLLHRARSRVRRALEVYLGD
jgi:RNA polymerase sigma-70 factor (ECF subfamily)